MSGIRFSNDFKKDAVSQVVDRGYSVRDVADRLAISTKSLYTWKAQFSKPDKVLDDEAALSSELRRVKRELTQKEIDRGLRYNRPVSLILMDVDRFKRVNDTYGHPAGDAVLRALSATCAEGLRDQDVFGRLGGEEFVIMLPETDIETATDVANRLRLTIANMKVPIPTGTGAGTGTGTGSEAGSNTQDLSITVSFGVAQCADNGETVEACLSRADKALYEAKNGGRNRVMIAA